MTAYPTLFDAPPTLGTARKSDPATSVAAARAKRPALDQQRAFDALVANGGAGTIDDVCAHFAAIGVARDRGSLSRRLTDLEAAGRIRRTDDTVPGSRGRCVAVWRVTS
ncbi:MAG TPA: hypothetical protein VFK52_10680 [Nocardioidaceae bacterium]|nr:hypothetical protein [Nocardioidaceae bacterium]